MSNSLNNPATHKKFYDMVEDYRGTCNSLSTEDEEWLDNHDLLAAFDDEIFECEFCGWWCEISEESEHNERVCIGCDEEAR